VRANAVKKRRPIGSSDCGQLAACDPDVTGIIHGFNSVDSANVAGEPRRLWSYAQSGVDAEDSSARYGKIRRSVLLVQVGTATSTRCRNEVISL
jgi:hypothetical protein